MKHQSMTPLEAVLLVCCLLAVLAMEVIAKDRHHPRTVSRSSVAPEICAQDGHVSRVTLSGTVYTVYCSNGTIKLGSK